MKVNEIHSKHKRSNASFSTVDEGRFSHEIFIILRLLENIYFILFSKAGQFPKRQPTILRRLLTSLSTTGKEGCISIERQPTEPTATFVKASLHDYQQSTFLAWVIGAGIVSNYADNSDNTTIS